VLNYFNYFTEIEERFQQRRGALLLLSTLDWALIETWREAGIPLDAVLRGIDASFDKYEARQKRGRMRRINGLAWCAQAVMEAAVELKEAATGTANPAAEGRESGFEPERVAAHPLRSDVLLPLGRLADMTLRPRVENLPIDLDWWVYARHHLDTEFSWAYVGLNAVYLLLGVAGMWLYARQTEAGSIGHQLWIPMAAYLVLRSALLLTVGAPETRYTLEFFPILCAAGGLALYSGIRACVPGRHMR